MNKQLAKLKNINININPKSTQVILAACVAVFFIIVVVFVVFGIEEDDEMMIGDVPRTVDAETNNHVVAPPVLENPFDENRLEEAQAQATIEANNADSNAEIEALIPTMGQAETEQSVKKEPIRIKPEDMIVYLKGIKEDIRMQDNSFLHNNIYYYVGDKFEGWWVIERITPNFIRFQEKDYSYNLRFFIKDFR